MFKAFNFYTFERFEHEKASAAADAFCLGFRFGR